MGADTPLSAVLAPGEDWVRLPEDQLALPMTEFTVQTDEKGNTSIHHPLHRKPVAVAGPGETFGSVVQSPAGGKLVVSVPSHHYLYIFRINTDGTLDAKEKCYVLRRERPGKGGSNVGTMAFDTKGRLWVAMPEGVQYFDEEMRFSGQLSRPTRDRVTHVWFGGANRDELHILCGAKTWKRKVFAIGAP
jgi:hypothetical protein